MCVAVSLAFTFSLPSWWTLWVASHMCVANCIDQLQFHALQHEKWKNKKTALDFLR